MRTALTVAVICLMAYVLATNLLRPDSLRCQVAWIAVSVIGISANYAGRRQRRREIVQKRRTFSTMAIICLVAYLITPVFMPLPSDICFVAWVLVCLIGIGAYYVGLRACF